MRRLSMILLGLGLGLAWTTSAAVAADTTVQVRDNSFDPKAITVAAGDKVVWDFVGENPHSVSADDGSFDSHPNCSGSSFTSCSNVASPNFERTFTTPGTYAYYCRIHGGKGGAGMSGVVTVPGPQPAATTTAPTPSTTTPPSTTTAPSTAPTLAQAGPTSTARQTTPPIAQATTTAGVPTTSAPQTGAAETTTSVGDATTTSTTLVLEVETGDGGGIPIALIILGTIAVLAAGGYAFYRYYPRPGSSGPTAPPA